MSKIAELNETVELKINGEAHVLPVVVGTENEHGIDISKLRGGTSYITLDPGFKNTGSTKSAITFLNGEKGVLRYRGYAIEDLAAKACFLEVAYLSIHGELPTAAQLKNLEDRVKAESDLSDSMAAMMDSFPDESHPMGMLAATVVALSGYHADAMDPYRSDEDKEKTMIQLMGKLPVLSAWIYRKKIGKPYLAPNKDLGYIENFLYMMYAEEGQPYTPDEAVVEALDNLLILHVDHEQNCSASTVRIVGSSHANLFASIAAGVTALWGPLHGGANQRVIEMLESIKADGGDTDKWLNKAKDKEDPFRLMGFGHRVYKNFDPRARIIKKSADKVLTGLGIQDPVLDIAKGLEEAALSDEYFAKRKLYPNVDFYSGIIYRALGIPTDMFTVMFAIGRLPGWIAQWKEMRDDGAPIGRPRQIYVGHTERPFVAMENR
ncbi:MAG TPA: citrate synthase [Bacteroidetes bacterium]|nr:citrate synthase [Bacteroidota bacterium]